MSLTATEPDTGWSPSSARYFDRATGRFISTDNVLGVLESRVQSGFDNLDDMLAAVIVGDADIALWQNAMALELKNMHVQAMALGRGGWGQVTQSDWGKVGARLRSEYGFLDNLVAEIAAGNLSEAEIRNRVKMFADGPVNTFWKGHTASKIEAGAVSEERVLNPAAAHCVDCIGFANQGVVPIGTLPEPGERSQCLSRCRCEKNYFDAQGNKI